MIPSAFQPLVNHLWQSTLFAAAAGLLTLAFRRNRAQTRHWLWLAASVKGSSGESVGNLRVSALGLGEETVELAAGGIKRTLFVFPAVVDQRTAVLMDHAADKLFHGSLP